MPPVMKHIRKSLPSRNDITVITPNLSVTNVGINTIATNLVQHKVWNITTVVKETILLKYVEAVLLQSTTRKFTVLHKSSDWKVTILVNHQKTCFKIDTGAQCDVISRQKYHQLSLMLLQISHARLVAFGGQRLNACGKVTINCQHKGKFYPVIFEVIDQDVPNILGLTTCVELNGP